MFGLFGVLGMKLWICFPFEMNMVLMDFGWIVFSFGIGRKGNEKKKKEKTPIYVTCTTTRVFIDENVYRLPEIEPSNHQEQVSIVNDR
jgi:hypothetical protein